MARAFKKAFADAAHVVLINETSLFINSLVRRTWAPKGKTLVLEGWGGHRHKVSVIGAIPFRWSRAVSAATSAPTRAATSAPSRSSICSGTSSGQVIVVWDGGSNYKGPGMREFLRLNR